MTTTTRIFLRFSFPKALARLLFVFIAPFVFMMAASAQNPVPLLNQPLVPDAKAQGGPVQFQGTVALPKQPADLRNPWRFTP
jgi:hypothetical protein